MTTAQYHPYEGNDFTPPYCRLASGVHSGRIVKAVKTDEAYRSTVANVPWRVEELCWGQSPTPIHWDELDPVDRCALLSARTITDDFGRAEDGPVDASYTPLDCGFDLRVHKHIAVELPAGELLRVRHMDGDRERVTQGTRQQVMDELDRCGYRVGSECDGRR